MTQPMRADIKTEGQSISVRNEKDGRVTLFISTDCYRDGYSVPLTPEQATSLGVALTTIAFPLLPSPAHQRDPEDECECGSHG